jgi:predicted transposase/invertase (TIGR01784 family)
MTRTNDRKETEDGTIYLNPLTDFGFKKIFGDKELLINFLNETIQQAQIVDVEYKPTEQLGDWDTERKAVLDLLCTNDKGEYFLVEMQRTMQKFFADRALFYSSFLIRSQAPKTKIWNYELKAVYVVSILNFNLSADDAAEEEKRVIERVSLMNERTKERFSDKLKFIYIQLSNFTKTPEMLQTNMDYWLYLLRNLAALQKRLPEVQGRIFERLFNIARKDKLNTEEMRTYNKSIMEYNDVRNSIQYAEERGEKRGISIGEEQNAVKIVVKCHTKGMPVEEIAELTELPVNKVKSIIERIQ